MSTTIRTGTAAHQTRASESFFGRVRRVISETFNPPTPQVKEQGPDRFTKTPVSVASVRRNNSVLAGYGQEGPTARRSVSAYSQDDYIALCNEIGKIDNG